MKPSTLTAEHPSLPLATARTRGEARSIRPVLGIAASALILLVGLRGHYLPTAPRMEWVLWLCYFSLAFTQIVGWAALLSEHPQRQVARASGGQRDVLAGAGYDLRPAVERARRMALSSFAFAALTFAAFAWANH